MKKEFTKIYNHMRTYLLASQIFGKKFSLEEIKRDIQRIDMDEALYTLATLTSNNAKEKNQLKEILKNFINETDNDFIEKLDAYDVSNLMYSMKWFIAYGKKNGTGFENHLPRQFNVFLIVLKISDYMVEKIDNTTEIEEMIFKGWLVANNQNVDIARSLLRQHIMFEDIARNRTLFDTNDYLDIHQKFEEKYGYSMKEYVATVTSLNQPSIKGSSFSEILSSSSSWGIKIESFFDKTPLKTKALSVYNDLIIDAANLRDWARQTIDNPYDFEKFLEYPIFKFADKIFPNSPSNIASLIFDGLFFRIRRCYDAKDKSFLDFFGKLFERYVEKLLKDSVEESSMNYTFIEEFVYEQNQNRSSDAYVSLGKSLLVIECKSGRIRRETKLKATPQDLSKDFLKFAKKPIEQASKALTDIEKLQIKGIDNAKKVFVLSVSMLPFPKIPKLHDDLKNKEWIKELNPKIKLIDYLGISEIEVIAYVIAKSNKTIFRFIQDKNIHGDYIPYINYYFKKYGAFKRTDIENLKLKEIFENMKNVFNFEEDILIKDLNKEKAD